MAWNWQQADWPHFTYDSARLQPFEARLALETGRLFGAIQHLSEGDRTTLTVELVSQEAFSTSDIEGEVLSRESLQSSIRRQFGLASDDRRIPPAEQGMAEVMVDVYRGFAAPLLDETLWAWHRMMMRGRFNLVDVGCYRTHSDAMQVVSGSWHAPRIHFEAPLSARVPAEMQQFLAWFNATAPDQKTPLPGFIRAGIAHLYFESIHPFEDGNGRIGRAIAEKALAQAWGQPTLLALSDAIRRNKKAYYAALEAASKTCELTDWLLYFADLLLAAQRETQRRIVFVIEKAKFYERLHDALNPRQEKVLARMFREGPDGFTGGLSAENYTSITKTSPATATRDLQDLVRKGALHRQGERRYARYFLNVGDTAVQGSILR
jgi:Fic family protein